MSKAFLDPKRFLTRWVGERLGELQARRVARTPRIPSELTGRPFSLGEARAAGLTLDALRGRSWRRLGSGLYCWVGLREDAWQVLQAWQCRLPNAVFTGLTAAWLHRLDVDPAQPIEVAVPPVSGVRSRLNLSVRRRHLPISDLAIVRGLRATTVQRTLSDVCKRLPSVEALVVLDEALRKRLGRASTSLGMLAEPAESPMETRLRWLLLEAGLPRPEVQVDLRDANARFVGRADLYYPQARLVIEYDGANHRDRLMEDNRRQNALVSAGFRVLRYTASDVFQRPGFVVTQVRQVLASGTASRVGAKSA